MAKQTFTTGSVLTATQMNNLQANDYNWTVSQKTASYVLVAADAGTRIEMNTASNTTVTVNTGLFTAGDTLFIQNIGSGSCVITAGTATVQKAANASLTLAQYQGGYLYFVSASNAVFFADAGFTSPLTTKGDLFTWDTGNARLAVGTNGQVLTADSTAATGIKWATASVSFVGASVYKSANQSLTNGTLTAISFNTEYFDTNSMHDNVTNNSRITVASGQAGKYLLVGNLVYAANATGFRHFFIRINGSNTWYSASNPAIPAYASFPNYVSYSFVLDLAAGDYVELFGLQNSGGALDVQGGDLGVSYFQLIKVG